MSNTSYCRFQNTSQDLYDCLEYIQDFDLSEDEYLARKRLINSCASVFNLLGVDFSEEELDNAKKELQLEYEQYLEDDHE